MENSSQLGHWVAPGTAERSGPSALDYEDEHTGPVTGAVTLPLPGATLPTFAEIRHHAPFDWNAFLAAPRHSEDEWNHAKNLAGSWVTCACGNQCSALERDQSGQPTDYLLSSLGEDFLQEILAQDVPSARITLHCIEQRSALLLTTLAALTAGKECLNCGGLGCPNCHGGVAAKAAEPVPCGGCGASHPNERCLGCRHDFQVLGAWNGREQAHA